MSYSEDLRKLVVCFVEEGGSKSEAVRLFKVSRGCIYSWLKRPCLKPNKTGPKKPWKLDGEALRKHVEGALDAYHRERAVALGVSDFAIRYGLKRLGITRKKNASVPRKK